ncbi:MAG: hypothetical protein AB1761_00705 [Pseudomonadota bacterium]
MIYLPVLSLAVSCITIWALRPAAPAAGLLDQPGGRKTHVGAVPLVGGVGMFVALVVGVTLMPATDPDAKHLLVASALLLAVGIADDRFDVSARARLLAHMTAALVAVLTLEGAPRLSFGYAFGSGETALTGWAATAAAVVLVGGTINAFNMIDGMDGLAGAMALVALAALGWMVAFTQDAFSWQLSLVAMGAVVGFLLFNLPVRFNRGRRVFMGDAGSTLLGFLVAALCMRLSQETRAVAPATLLWFVALPVTDLLVTMLRRIARGVSPFRPDRGHLHHRLLDAGLGVRATLAILTTVAVLLAAAGLWMHYAKVPEAVQFYGFLCAVALVAFTASRANRWAALLAPPRRVLVVPVRAASPAKETDEQAEGAQGE